MADDLKVTFTDDIPKIEREGSGRKGSSKYNELLDACVENAGKAARLVVDTQGKASSRASSIRTAAQTHSAVGSNDGLGGFEVATRAIEQDDEGNGEFHVYVRFDPEGDPEELKPKKRPRKAKNNENGEGEAKTEAKPRPKKKVAKKA